MADVFPGAQLVQTDGFFARAKPSPQEAFSVVHITASLRSAENEVRGRQIAAGGVTATFFVDPDGAPWQQLGNPLLMAPWTNGVLNRPDLTNPRIADVVRDQVNPNLRTLVSIENVGLEPGNPITAAQERTAARIIAYYHARAGVPISRETVIGHYQIDSVNRPNCPSTNKAILNRIVAAAQGADSMTIVTYTPFPEGARTWAAVGGKTVGYHPDGSSKTVDLGAGSQAQATGTATITQDPQKAPNGSGFVLIANGILAGYYVVRTAGTVAPGPAPTPDQLAQAYNDGLAAAQVAVEALPER